MRVQSTECSIFNTVSAALVSGARDGGAMNAGAFCGSDKNSSGNDRHFENTYISSKTHNGLINFVNFNANLQN
jgi:hypothetical protein